MRFILVDDSADATRGAAATAIASRQAAAYHTKSAAAATAVRQPPRAAPSAVLPAGRNRRWSQRSAAQMAGTIGGAGADTPIRCTVIDLSKHGAMLEPAADTHLPECFVLVFFNRRTRCEANCVVRWQRDGRVGVCFAGPVRSSISRQ